MTMNEVEAQDRTIEAASTLRQLTIIAASEMENSAQIDLGDTLGAIRLVELAAAQARECVIAEMRARGSSWAEIGDALGTTRQNAQQRYGRGEPNPWPTIQANADQFE